MEAFARALRQIPATIADNAGLDSAGEQQQGAVAWQRGVVALWLGCAGRY